MLSSQWGTLIASLWLLRNRAAFSYHLRCRWRIVVSSRTNRCGPGRVRNVSGTLWPRSYVGLLRFDVYLRLIVVEIRCLNHGCARAHNLLNRLSVK
ncbi:hypothetical protein BDD12DRAFT_44140 [Trichophaea hybrida]|nr:hypothetical protein BDD12DRAFT_44140 [Trichophaea hybrida]